MSNPPKETDGVPQVPEKELSPVSRDHRARRLIKDAVKVWALENKLDD